MRLVGSRRPGSVYFLPVTIPVEAFPAEADREVMYSMSRLAWRARKAPRGRDERDPRYPPQRSV
jgi:hypothetical protein